MFLRASSAMLSSMLCAAALALLSASPALASCGDWLAHGWATVHAARLPVLAKAFDVAARVDSWLANDAGRPERAPCHGPNCHRVPEPTAPPVPSDRTLGGEKTLPVAAANQSERNDFRLSSDGESHVHPLSGYASRLDHPPRLA